jgi:hypothetical protein
MQKKIYFAYGANTNKDAMAIRCPKAKVICAGHITNFRLKFNNVADIVATDSSYGVDAPCVIWEITKDCEERLDRFEGFPELYSKINVEGYEGCQYQEQYKGFAYKMNYEGFHTPSPSYVRGIRNGLKGVWDNFYHADIDNHIDKAIIESFRQSERFTVQPRVVGGKQWR